MPDLQRKPLKPGDARGKETRATDNKQPSQSLQRISSQIQGLQGEGAYGDALWEEARRSRDHSELFSVADVVARVVQECR